MTGQQLTIKDKVTNIRALLQKAKPQMEMALPKHLSADRLLRVAMTTIQQNPKLLEATPESLIGALMQCAQLGLEPDGLLGHAYLVPFKNKRNNQYVTEVVLIPGYKGLYKLVRNSGELSTVSVNVVYKQDHFSLKEGLEPQLDHIRAEEAHEGKDADIRGAYAIARLKDGGIQFCFMWKWEIEKVRQMSKAKDVGPWVTHWPEMAKKTVLRRLAKLLPASVEIQKAVTLDERAEAGISQELDTTIDIPATEAAANNDKPKSSKLDDLVDNAKTKKPPPERPEPETLKPRVGAEPPKEQPAGHPDYAEGADPEPGEHDRVF